MIHSQISNSWVVLKKEANSFLILVYLHVKAPDNHEPINLLIVNPYVNSPDSPEPLYLLFEHNLIYPPHTPSFQPPVNSHLPRIGMMFMKIKLHNVVLQSMALVLSPFSCNATLFVIFLSVVLSAKLQKT